MSFFKKGDTIQGGTLFKGVTLFLKGNTVCIILVLVQYSWSIILWSIHSSKPSLACPQAAYFEKPLMLMNKVFTTSILQHTIPL